MPHRRLNIIVWGINYWPEQTGIAPFNQGLCEYLHQAGHRVRMISGFSYYPAWKKSPEDARRLFRTDLINDIPVDRCWQYVPARASVAGRLLHELSFGFTSFLRVLIRPRADLYLVVSPPLLLGPLAWIASRLKRSRYVFHVQDLQPDAALALKMIKEGVFVSLLRQTAGFSYRHAAVVSGISPSMIEVFASKQVPASRRYLFPNWVMMKTDVGASGGGRAELARNSPVQAMRSAATPKPSTDSGPLETLELRHAAVPLPEWRRRFQIPPDAFVASYSGNLGRKQGLNVLVDVAINLDLQERPGSRPICIVIAGDGAGRADIESRLGSQPPKSLRLLPLLSSEDYESLLATSDVCLITQSPGTGRFCFPSKLLSALRLSRPIMAVADDTSELACAVRDGRFGVLIPPEAPETLAAALVDLRKCPESLESFSEKGKVWVGRFERGVVLHQFEDRLQQLVADA